MHLTREQMKWLDWWVDVDVCRASCNRHDLRVLSSIPIKSVRVVVGGCEWLRVYVRIRACPCVCACYSKYAFFQHVIADLWRAGWCHRLIFCQWKFEAI